MTVRYYNIARCTIGVEGEHELELLARLPGFGVFAVAAGEPDLVVSFGHTVEIPQQEPLHRFDFEESGYSCRYYGTGTERVFVMERDGGKLYALRQADSHAWASSVDEPSALRFLIWMAMSIYGTPRGLAPVHAACISFENQAVAFLGESGTGKSTHAQLWLKNVAGTKLLNDDSPILRVGQNRAELFGSPWSGKTHCYSNIGLPLRALVRLNQRATNSIEPLNMLHAIAAIEPSLPPALRYDEAMTDHRLTMIARLTRLCGVFAMGCRPDDEAARMCQAACFGTRQGD
ncbi:MAG: hypothetical protein IJ789_02205 [Bacteroidales bacterium]|nr:hypothetical protein [Bacteroidales bacterium]